MTETIFDWASQYLREKEKLPSDWAASYIGLIPEDGPHTHVKVKGSICRPKKRGDLMWTDRAKREFILGIGEYRSLWRD